MFGNIIFACNKVTDTQSNERYLRVIEWELGMKREWGNRNGPWNERITAETIIKTNNKMHVAIKIGSHIKIYICVCV